MCVCVSVIVNAVVRALGKLWRRAWQREGVRARGEAVAGRYATWFQRHEEPSITTDEYEQARKAAARHSCEPWRPVAAAANTACRMCTGSEQARVRVRNAARTATHHTCRTCNVRAWVHAALRLQVAAHRNRTTGAERKGGQS